MTPARDSVTATQLFLIFTRIGLTSFGGGLSGWLYREFVQTRAWLTEDEFLSGLALAQTLPGINVSNMAIWIGNRLLGFRGACVCLAGIVAMPAILIIVIAVAFASLMTFPYVHVALIGAAAAAIGLSLSMGLTAARRLPLKILPMATLAAVFIAIGPLHLPLVWIVVLGAPLSIALSFLAARLAAAKADRP